MGEFYTVKVFRFRILTKSQPQNAELGRLYTETIKLCPLDVYVCQFQMYKHISSKFSYYQLWSFRKVLHTRDIHSIISRAADKAANTSTLKIKSHKISSCVSVIIPNRSSTLKHHWANSLEGCYACWLYALLLRPQPLICNILWRHKTSITSVCENTQKIHFWPSILIIIIIE